MRHFIDNNANHDNDKYLEQLVRRRPTAAELAANPEARLGETIAAMDSFKTTDRILNGLLRAFVS